jgi:fumarate reductase (CoM/CoB) subunit A
LSEQQWRDDPFSASLEHILGNQYGARQHPVGVAPAAHHTMGGVRITNDCATSVPGLFAAGEIAGGLHGANRMGGNALSETMVFGARAGHSAANWAKASSGSYRQAQLEQPNLRPGPERDELLLADLQAKLRKTMWENGGIIRNEKGLVRAADIVEELREQALGLSTECSGRDLIDVLELRSAIRIAGLIVQGALKRTETRGAHCREDFPDQDDEKWRGHLQVRMTNAEDTWDYAPETAKDTLPLPL